MQPYLYSRPHGGAYLCQAMGTLMIIVFMLAKALSDRYDKARRHTHPTHKHAPANVGLHAPGAADVQHLDDAVVTLGARLGPLEQPEPLALHEAGGVGLEQQPGHQSQQHVGLCVARIEDAEEAVTSQSTRTIRNPESTSTVL